MEFSRQEYCGLPFPSPGDLPNSGIEPGSPTLQADSLPSELPGKPMDKLNFLSISIFLTCVCVCVCVCVCAHTLFRDWLFATPWTVCEPARLLYPRDSPGENTGVGCSFLFQKIFPIQGSNPCPLRLLHRQVDSLPLAPPGQPISPVLSLKFHQMLFLDTAYEFSLHSECDKNN